MFSALTVFVFVCVTISGSMASESSAAPNTAEKADCIARNLAALQPLLAQFPKSIVLAERITVKLINHLQSNFVWVK